ncbi:hypothetical protein [Bacillus ndiopicus]|uniref:hypothetical protein n=1 Tax=Bacillus ndiopicus TaxID=1347368 RepID=UPI0018A866AE|nr:hypothetical protein [Bacillus ndiopicus]
MANRKVHMLGGTRKEEVMNISSIFSILLSAVLAFLIAAYFEQPLHWYLFILIVCIGFFIQLIIIILQAPDELE